MSGNELDVDGGSDEEQILSLLETTLRYSRNQNYVGWDKHDGMSSRIRQWLPFESKWTNLVIQESIKRAPINLRPLFLVEQRPSPKGLSLFTIANCNTYDLTRNKLYKKESLGLVDQISSLNLDSYEGFGLYHNHELQGLHEKSSIGNPSTVATSYGVRALLRVANFDPEVGELARTASTFVETELDPVESGSEVRVQYKSGDTGDSYTINANAIAARLFVDLYDAFGSQGYRELAIGLLSYVANQQHECGGWEYRDPPSASHLGMDNYHNGFIIESFLRYQEVVDSEAFENTVEDGIKFYRDILYEDNGAPCWDESSAYPRDIHAAAQGIIVFTHADDLEFARRIIDWTIENLYRGDGQFYYQKRKYYTKRFTLMRWCQAWMAYALSEYMIAQADRG